MDQLKTPGQVADLLQIRRETLFRWVASGRFPEPMKLGARWVRWKTSTVEEWIEQQQPQNAEREKVEA